jgi:tetratricopeptide (TPR) repeat protein
VKRPRARGVFIGQRKDRLGARLLMMLTCIRLAKDFDAEYRVNWFPRGADAPELDSPAELFDVDWMHTHFLSSDGFDTLEQTSAPIAAFKNDPDPSRLLAHLAAGHAVIVEEGFEVFAFPWENFDGIRERYNGFINQIAFAPELRPYMAQIDQALADKGASAYHIRRGDILNGLPWKHSTWPAKIEPEELYERHLEKNIGQAAIMFSDQPETLAAFCAKYPWLKQMSDISDLSGLTRSQRDFLELYAMSRADRIVAPIISAFSSAAARLSGRQRLVFRDVLDEAELTQAHERLLTRARLGTSAFINASEQAHLYSKLEQYLNANDRAQEAYDLCADVLNAGADNAFVPILQTLNCVYLSKWKEAAKHARAGLENPNLWPEDFSVLSALLGAIQGARKKRWSAGRYYSGAFWAKPMRPDVVVLGSRMIYRDHLPERQFPPIDWDLLKFVRQPWYTPFNNLYLVQWKVIGRRPCNMDMILLDWSDFALDQKARGLLDSPPRLTALQDALDRVKDFAPTTPQHTSLSAILDFRLGGSARGSLAKNARALADVPDSALYHKRQADILEASGDMTGARMALTEALAQHSDNAFLLYVLGRFLERIGEQDQCDQLILQAAELDIGTAMIQGEAGRILLRQGRLEDALITLEKARALCPTYKRYSNQIERIKEKAAAV